MSVGVATLPVQQKEAKSNSRKRRRMTLENILSRNRSRKVPKDGKQKGFDNNVQFSASLESNNNTTLDKEIEVEEKAAEETSR